MAPTGLDRRHGLIVLLGGPGAGKGTQARLLSEALGVPHVASGELLREHRRRGTALGRAAARYMDRGDLVPDDLVLDMVLAWLAEADTQHGVVLDGFPRTLAQAQMLDARLTERGSTLRAAIYLEVPSEVLVARLAGRRLRGDTTAAGPERSSPAPGGHGRDRSGGLPHPRSDDRPDVARNRIAVYMRETLPVIAYYATRGLLLRINGHRPIEEVHEQVMRALAPSLPA